MTEEADRVSINSLQYLLIPGEYEVQDITPFAEQIRQGTPTYHDFAWESITAQSDWHKGFAQAVLGSEQRYNTAVDCDARIPRQVTLSALLTTLTLAGLAVDAKVYAGKLYIAVDQVGVYEYRRHTGTLNKISGTTFADFKMRKGCLEVFNGKLYACSPDVNIQTWDGATLAQAAAKKYDYICKVGKQFYGALRPSTLEVSTDGTTFATVSNWTTVHVNITSLAEHDNRLYIGLEDNLGNVATDGTLTNMIPDLKDTPSSQNCVGMRPWRGLLRVPIGRQLITWTGSAVVNVSAQKSLGIVGFDESPESQASQLGTFHDLHGSTNFLYAIQEDANHNYTVFAYYERPELQLGEGWHPIQDLGVNACDLVHVWALSDESSLLEHFDNAVTPATLKYGTGFTLTTGATYDASTFKFGNYALKLPATTACTVTSTQKVTLPENCCVEFWVYVPAADVRGSDTTNFTTCPRITLGDVTKHGYIFLFGDSGSIQLWNDTATSLSANQYASGVLATGWHHCALHFKDGTSRVWLIDGVAVAANTTFNFAVDTAQPILINAYASMATDVQFDEFRISTGDVYDTQRNTAYPADSPLLFLGYGANMRTVVLPRVSPNPLLDSTYRYAASGTFTTSDIDLGLKGQVKAYLQVDVFWQQVAAGVTGRVYYSIDGGAWTSDFVDSAGASVTTITTVGWTSLYFPVNTTGKRIALRFDLATNDSTTTPVLKAYQLHQFVRIPIRRRWLCGVMIANDADLNDSRSGKTKLDNLYTARDLSAPITFVDRYLKSWQAVVESVHVKEVIKEKDTPPENHGSVILKEWKAT